MGTMMQRFVLRLKIRSIRIDFPICMTAFPCSGCENPVCRAARPASAAGRLFGNRAPADQEKGRRASCPRPLRLVGLVMQLCQYSTAGFVKPKIKESVKKRKRLNKVGGENRVHWLSRIIPGEKTCQTCEKHARVAKLMPEKKNVKRLSTTCMILWQKILSFGFGKNRQGKKAFPPSPLHT